MPVMLDNSKTYLRQMDQAEVTKDFWPKLKGGQLNASIWRNGQTQPHIIKKVVGVGDSALELTPEEKNAHEMQTEFNGLTVFMKFRLSEETQFFTAGSFAWDAQSKKYTIQLDKPFFVTTKRTACRYITTEVDRISVNIAGKSFFCADISSGGFSTQVKRDQVSGLEKGSSFEQVLLKYSLKSFTIPTVTLVNIIEIAALPNEVKLAFKFEGLRPKDEDAIWVEVNKSIKRVADLMGG